MKDYRRVGLVVLAGLLLVTAGSAQPRPTAPGGSAPSSGTAAAKFTPKFEAWAETKLLMEGLADANYRSLSKRLKARPTDNETWMFARGQALLIAEAGNLLLLRPPRNEGRDTWMKLAMAMRDQAGSLARAAGSRDYAKSKAELELLTAACNRCHTTFRVPVRMKPDGADGERDVSAHAPAGVVE